MWLAVTFVVDADRSEALSDALMEAGALSVEVSDADAGTPHERPIFDEPGGERSAQWLRGRVSALFPREADVNALSAHAILKYTKNTVYTNPRSIDRRKKRDGNSTYEYTYKFAHS